MVFMARTPATAAWLTAECGKLLSMSESTRSQAAAGHTLWDAWLESEKTLGRFAGSVDLSSRQLRSSGLLRAKHQISFVCPAVSRKLTCADFFLDVV